MSLDSWLAHGNPDHLPPPKRVKLSMSQNLDIPSSSPMRITSDLESFGSSGVREAHPSGLTTFEAPPKLQVKSLTSQFDLPPEATFGLKAVCNWKPSTFNRVDRPTLWVECLRQSPVTAIGLDSPSSIFIIQKSGQNDENHYAIDLPFDWPLLAMTRLDGDESLLCASKREVSCVSLAHMSSAPLPFFDHNSLDEISSISVNGPLVTVGSASGSLDVWDLRGKAWVRSWSRAHAVGGASLNRFNPAVSHIEWTSDNVLATAGKHNETVKFWDMRGRSKAPLNSTQDRTSPKQSKLAGIRGLASVEGRIWALNARSELLKLSEVHPAPEYRIKLGMKPAKPRQALAFVQTSYPLLACAGTGGTTIMTLPSSSADELGVDAVQARRLNTFGIDSTAVQWHPYTRELVTVYDYGWRFWDPMRGDEPLHRVGARQQPIYY